jgi:hypothetical protein
MGLLAGLIGLLLVVVYSLFQYRALGFVTIASLVVAGALTYLAIAILGWTENYRLSLAGVAGIIVSIGQTADSFIVYFERIRDELREGRAWCLRWRTAGSGPSGPSWHPRRSTSWLHWFCTSWPSATCGLCLHARPDRHRRPHRRLHVHPPHAAAAGQDPVLWRRPQVLRP